MTITKIVNKERVICESSYYEWWQSVSYLDSQPSFKDVFLKICQECGTEEDDVAYKPMDYLYDSIVEEHASSIHGVVVVITHSRTPDSMEIKTSMRTTNAQHDWVVYHKDPTDLFIPYFETFLSNLRNVWYEQHKVDIGS